MAGSGWQFFFTLLGIGAVLVCGPALVLYLFLPRKRQFAAGSGDAPDIAP
jgi:hypothetical protein